MSLKNAKASTKTSATGGRAGCPGHSIPMRPATAEACYTKQLALDMWRPWGMGKDPQMGVSENSVPLHPMVNDHYPY